MIVATQYFPHQPAQAGHNDGHDGIGEEHDVDESPDEGHPEMRHGWNKIKNMNNIIKDCTYNDANQFHFRPALEGLPLPLLYFCLCGLDLGFALGWGGTPM